MATAATTSRSEPDARNRVLPTAPSRWARVGSLCLVLWMTACAAPIRLISEPSGASLSWVPRGQAVAHAGRTPVDVSVPLLKPLHVTLRLPGYRPVTLELHRLEGRPLRFLEGEAWLRRREVHVQLVPGGAGRDDEATSNDAIDVRPPNEAEVERPTVIPAGG